MTYPRLSVERASTVVLQTEGRTRVFGCRSHSVDRALKLAKNKKKNDDGLTTTVNLGGTLFLGRSETRNFALTSVRRTHELKVHRGRAPTVARGSEK